MKLPRIPAHRVPWYAWAGGSLAAFAALEARALKDQEPGTTLSATWWDLRTHLPVRLLVFPPLAWVGWHLFVPWDRKTGGPDDAAVIIAGVAVAVAAQYRPRAGA